VPHYIQDHNGISVASQLTTHPPLYVVLLFASASTTATSRPPPSLPPPMHIPFVFYTSRLIAPSRFTRIRIARLRFRRCCGRLLLGASIRDVKLTLKFMRKNYFSTFQYFWDILISVVRVFQSAQHIQIKSKIAKRSCLTQNIFMTCKLKINRSDIETERNACRCYMHAAATT